MLVTYASLSPEASLRRRTALVTGAATGLGRAMAEALDELGCNVLAVDTDEAAMRDLALDAVAVTELVPVDVYDPAQIAAFGAEWGDEPIHVVINAAASLLPQTHEDAASFATVWGAAVNANAKAAGNVIRAVEPALSAGKGSVVNISPFLLLPPPAGVLRKPVTGGQLATLTKAEAERLAPLGIKVNAVLSWRVERPEALLGPTIFLASAMSALLNGVLLTVDGPVDGNR